MAAVAAEIATARPDLVGLQEAATYQSASHGSYDFTALLRRYLSRRGLRYSVVANATNVDVTVPIDGGDFVRFTDHDVLLAHTARGAKKLTITHRQSGHYADVTVVNGPLAPVVFSRGWTSADVELGKRSFNIVETHLEAFDNAQQAAQAHELIAGPAASRLPTIVMGDLNSNASSGPDQTEAYPDLIAAGFKDLWSLARPADPGYTCCQAADLRNTASRLDKRIDVVLGRGAFTPVAAAVVGDNAAVRARIGVWASDHAGVTMTLRLR
jgi:endonuclease/exonuclease/phosphatase family metal-dependent hydrolase